MSTSEHNTSPGGNTAVSDSEIAKLLWDRWIHLERLLVTAIFAMFLTSTIALFAAATKLDANQSTEFTDNSFILGAGAAYAILAGYYYFMLTQNYAAMAGLLRLDAPVVRKASALWDYFKPAHAPVAGFRHQFRLLPAATVPLTITVVALIGLRACLSHETVACFSGVLAFHIFLFFHMMWSPYRRFVSEIRRFGNSSKD